MCLWVCVWVEGIVTASTEAMEDLPEKVTWGRDLRDAGLKEYSRKGERSQDPEAGARSACQR